jgi:dihydroneopterin aldolase
LLLLTARWCGGSAGTSTRAAATASLHLQHLAEYQEAYREVESAMKSKDFKLTDYVKVSAGEVSEGCINLGLTASTSKAVAKEHTKVILLPSCLLM